MNLFNKVTYKSELPLCVSVLPCIFPITGLSSIDRNAEYQDPFVMANFNIYPIVLHHNHRNALIMHQELLLGEGIL